MHDAVGVLRIEGCHVDDSATIFAALSYNDTSRVRSKCKVTLLNGPKRGDSFVSRVGAGDSHGNGWLVTRLHTCMVQQSSQADKSSKQIRRRHVLHELNKVTARFVADGAKQRCIR